MIQFHKHFLPACSVPGSGLGTNDTKMAMLPARNPQPIKGIDTQRPPKAASQLGRTWKEERGGSGYFRARGIQQGHGDPAE